MSRVIKVGLLGLGTVGTGVADLLINHSEDFERKVGAKVVLEKALVRELNKPRSIALADKITTDADELLDNSEIDIIVEVLGGETPAKDYILRALNSGKHVVTANKDVVAKFGRELFEAAEKNQTDLLFEASVGGGIPIIRPLKQCLAANRISEVMGIVNGTTNYMLTKMTKEGAEFDAVLKQAQQEGYAEADPTADVGGFDAARKIAILASIAFGTRVTVDDVYVEGIGSIEPEDIHYAAELGYAIKLLAIAKETKHGIDVRVHPAFIPLTHPLAAVNDVFNAIYVRGDAVGEAMFYGRGAGQMPTASAVVADIIDVARDIQHNVSGRILCTCYDQKPFCPHSQIASACYIRLLVEDKPGVLAAIAGMLGAQQVSLHSVIQKRKVGHLAEIVLITYPVAFSSLQIALNAIQGMGIVAKIKNVIRVEAEETE